MIPSPESVTTWADGFGLWNVRVTEQGVGNAAGAAETARTAIVDELAVREGSAFDPDAIAVELVSRTSKYGELVSHYRETSPDESSEIHPECLRFGYVQDGRCCGHSDPDST